MKNPENKLLYLNSESVENTYPKDPFYYPDSESFYKDENEASPHEKPPIQKRPNDNIWHRIINSRNQV